MNIKPKFTSTPIGTKIKSPREERSIKQVLFQSSESEEESEHDINLFTNSNEILSEISLNLSDSKHLSDEEPEEDLLNDPNVTVRTVRGKNTKKSVIEELTNSIRDISLSKLDDSPTTTKQAYDRENDRSRSLLYPNSNTRKEKRDKETLRTHILKRQMKNRIEIVSSDESMASLGDSVNSRDDKALMDVSNLKSKPLKKIIYSDEEDDEPNIAIKPLEQIQDESMASMRSQNSAIGKTASEKSMKTTKKIEISTDNESLLLGESKASSSKDGSELFDPEYSEVVDVGDSEEEEGDDESVKEVTIEEISSDEDISAPHITISDSDAEDDQQKASFHHRSASETPSSRHHISEESSLEGSPTRNRAQKILNMLDNLNMKRDEAVRSQNDGMILDLTRKISSLEHKLSSIESKANTLPKRITPPVRGPPIISPPRMITPPDGKRLFGGKMTEERLEKVETVTGDIIKSIHTSLSNIPEGQPTETPSGITVELMPHQKEGLTWFLWRENEKNPAGGILADDMGLGKTLSMISLILQQKNLRLEKRVEEPKRVPCDFEGLTMSKSTLIVAPASLVYQWESELQKFVRPGKLRVATFHGNNREDNPRILASNDVVLTTYGVIDSELTAKNIINDSAEKKSRKKWLPNKRSVLARIAWERIILDEAHNIKNRNSNRTRACCQLATEKRWCLTGTPIHNELWDLFSLIKFLRVSPFSEEQVWKQYIMDGRRNNERLNTLVKGLLLRRTKDQISSITQKPIVNLKPKNFEVVSVKMVGIERKCYQQMLLASKQQVKSMLGGDMNGDSRRQRDVAVKNPFIGARNNDYMDDNFQVMSSILVLLLRLRQAAVHMALTKEALDLDAFRDEGIARNEDDAMNRAIEQLNSTLGELSITAGAEHNDEELESLFTRNYKTAKIRAVLAQLDRVIEANDKCVIVSQWTSVLDILEIHLKKKGVNYTSITGNILTKDRQQRVNSFNKINSGAQVMLLSLTAGGVGLNLVGGNHLFLVDLHWNPALESQACDRIYRIGQTKDVYIHKFVTDESMEQRVFLIQDKKKELAKSVLEGVKSVNKNQLTRADIEFLFDLKPQRSVPGLPGPSQRY